MMKVFHIFANSLWLSATLDTVYCHTGGVDGTLDKEDFLYVIETAELSNTVYLNSTEIQSIYENATVYESIILNGDREGKVLNRAIFNEKHGACYVAFQGTNNEEGGLGEWVENTDFTTESVCRYDDNSTCCDMMGGFAEAYMQEDGEYTSFLLDESAVDQTSKTVQYETDFQYRDLLEEEIEVNCVDLGKPVIFTGHSQGGAIAMVAMMRFSGYSNAYAITHGAPAAFKSTECSYVDQDKIFRFINTDDGANHLDYDPVPYIGQIAKDINQLNIPKVISWLPIEKIREAINSGVLRDDDFGSQIGRVFLLPADTSSGVDLAFYENSALQPQIWWWILLDANAIGAHDMERMYIPKIKAFAYRGTASATGFDSWAECNFDSECKYFCVNLLFFCANKQNGDFCYTDNDCNSKRCATTWQGFRCLSKLARGEWCGWNSGNCESGYCSWRGRCA